MVKIWHLAPETEVLSCRFGYQQWVHQLKIASMPRLCNAVGRMDTQPQSKRSHVKEEYQQWKKAHRIMKDSPPPGGREYLMHAKSLLSLLEGIGEIHPVAKVVISSFKTIIMFETDRRDNDVRVTAVFLAQTDTMQILLDIDDLSSRQRYRADLRGLRSNAMLGNLLERIAKDIKECGNSIDAYYKESRLVKFWKSQDWKDRMLGYVETFSNHRIHLQQLVSLQVASGVGDLVSKMNEVLSRLYRPKSGWERELDAETHRLGDPAIWMNDEPTLRSLIALTDDPALPLHPIRQQNIWDPALPTDQARREELESSLIEKVRGELGLTLDVLCERNMDRFELRLNFYALQMREAIHQSTEIIVHALSGPHDRLENKDLRELWKEMDWIFCVENKLFSSALFEYYLDLFSTRRVGPLKVGTDQTKSGYSTGSLWSKSGLIDHVDAWTLDYMATYGERIVAAVDIDESGFIRISEANAFTRQIPNGWNLPQWCAYSAAGWVFEARIYRKRINHLLFKLKEAEMRALPTNRLWIGYGASYPITFDLCYAFWREPKGLNKPNISLELKNLVKEKILSQDSALRSKLSSLKWTIDAVSTIDILFGETSLESYILQLITIMLEYVLEISHTCCTVTLDIREWQRIFTTFNVMRQISIARLGSLKAQLSKRNGAQLIPDLDQYCGGIWSFFDAQLVRNQDYLKGVTRAFFDEYSRNVYSLEDFKDYISDSSFLDNFPLRPPSDSKPYLEYKSWEEATRNIQGIPSTIPNSWEFSDDGDFSTRGERMIVKNINDAWHCNQCGVDSGDKRYHCMECLDIDFCDRCFCVPKEDCKVPQHELHHPLILISFDLLPHQFRILEAEGKYHLEEIQYLLRARRRSEPDNPNIDAAVEDVGTASGKQNIPAILFVCGRCSESIPLDSVFFKCVGYSCNNLFICEKCVDEKEDVIGSEHKWWHHLLFLRRGIIEKIGETAEPSSPTAAAYADKGPAPINAPDTPGSTAAIVSAIKNTVEERISGLENSLSSRITGLENSLKSNNSLLDERMTRLESKMDNMMLELKEWLSNGLGAK